MLGVLLLYFIGKAFFDLAVDYDKYRYRWGYAILGIVCYYGSAILGGIVLFILYELFGSGSIDDLDERLLGFLELPLGLLGCWIGYKILQRRWDNQVARENDNDILDSDLL